jgi:hypothetical protein
MFRLLRSICIGAILATAGCATTPPPQAEQAQGPIGWGEAVNGLQVGIGAQLTQNPPGQPQAGAGYLTGVVVYLKNFGSTPLTIVDPKPITTGGAAKSFLWTIYTEPDHTAQVETLRIDPARVLTLTPGQSTSFSVPLPMLPRGQGAHRLVATYDNDDSVINIVSGSSSKPVSGVWTGHANSPELFVNDAP